MEKFRLGISTLVVFLGIVSCQTAPPSPFAASMEPTVTWTQTPTSSPSRTATPSPTILPSSTREITRTPSPTLAPGLTTAGPYLFLGDTAYELDGSGQLEITLPTSVSGNEGDYSPDMHWYAYVTGQENGLGTLPADEIVLHIKDLWTGSEKDIANLAPEDYRARLEKLAEDINQEIVIPSPEYQDLCEVTWYGLLLDMYLWHSWSPDGRYLAFAAMIDGNSSDVYLYDTDTGTINRKDDDELNVRYIGWSPDGRWIRYYNYIPYEFFCDAGNRNPTPDRFVRADSSNADFSINLDLIEWTFPQEWLMGEIRWPRVGQSVSIDGPWGFYTSLYLVNADTGARTKVWTDGWYNFAVDPGRKEIAILAAKPCKGYLGDGECDTDHSDLYIGPIARPKKRIAEIERIGKEIIFRNGTIHRYIVANRNYSSGPEFSDIGGLNKDGTIDPLKQGGISQFTFSPDHRWMAVAAKDGVTLFNQADEILFSWSDQEVGSLAWKTNSQGLFFTTQDSVYYLPIEKPEPRPVFQCGTHGCRGISLIPGIYLSSLPHLRAQPTPIDDPTQGTSIWYKTTYRDLYEPGTQEYTVNLLAYYAGRWHFSWCAKAQNRLADILEPLNLEFFIGGESIGEDVFRIYDTTGSGGHCRNWATLLSGWQPGDAADLEFRYTLSEAINDGTREYPAGEYRQIIHVKVE